MENKNLVTILWSGGWDGTFRMLQLAEHDIQIQPIYVIDQERKSTPYEKEAMYNIIEAIKKNPSFKAEILEIKYYEVQWILENCKNDVISKDFMYLRSMYGVGAQYEWFALLCNKLNIQMESAVVHQYHGKVEDAIEAEGVLGKLPGGGIEFLEERERVLPKGNNETAYHVFGNIILPVIHLSKQDEERIAREKNWMEIMKLSWFCHAPINGEPCGLCGPCDDAMNTGMDWRMPPKAQKRYRHKTLYRTIGRIKSIFG